MNSNFAKKAPRAPFSPSSVAAWPMMVTPIRPSMNPRITGVAMKLATQPNRSAPNRRKRRPMSTASVLVRAAKSGEPCAATAPTVSAEITPVAVSGPTTSTREVPSSA